MPEKKEPAPGWPIVSGEYVVGNPESCVGVVTLGSHGLEQAAVEAGAAIAGPCHTENLGIEKVIANYISNPNIRFMIVCGSEVQGHLTGQCFKALYENGIDDSGCIIGAKGAIPFLENVGKDAVERFQRQIVELVDLIDVEDTDKITQAIKECISKDPGATEGDVEEIDVEKKERGLPTVAKPDIEYTKKLMESLEYKVGLMTRDLGLSSGIQSSSLLGVILGSILAIVLLAIPVVLKVLLG
ncbi:MAG TPA: tetrahydromethanopterin S-methyltransferase subunit A [Methanothermococcus okinawensis]|uniref:Tetrahydromethanopterin S-methyltransferase subunit A n=1 Tax=Methanothermococcus okinawensis TaxID=155863 RepID=A0A832ZII8_9EURY|nr:tetrahydromethanopterin S-methyltransferase subunit A [Methanothermococcus okinawensis]HIP90781.1 tetrahydromethanopterin S-methyltransferase subunit A [Methanothermococcus okinawensis]